MQGIISNILPGLAGMPNLHPMVVHFPIALLSSFLALEILSQILKIESLKTGASWMLYIGTLGALAAVLAGFRAASIVEHEEVTHAIMETHEHLALAVLLLAVILSVWRILCRGKFKRTTLWLVYLALAFLMVGLMSFTADYGGLMVYTHGVGVKAAQKPVGVGQNNTPPKNHHDSTPHKH